MASPDGPAASALTPREAEVLALVRQRLTNNEIAEHLYVSVRTVETHVSALLRKLGVSDRRALSGTVLPSARSTPGPTRPALPSPLTPFIGRVSETGVLVEAVRRHRLVTAAGPGGVGKTRLSLAAARELSACFRDGVAFVDLVRVSEPDMVVPAVADAVGVAERVGTNRTDALLRALGERDCVLVLDNCEHVLDGARVCIEQLLGACPSVRVLATSRIRLMLPFEHVYAVPGLAIDEAEGADRSDAVELFVARMVDAGAPAPGDDDEHELARAVCRALDGMALAIELAAARVPGLGLEGLSQALGAQLSLLSVGRRADHRHRSLRAAIDWTYELLDDDERATLRAAALFAAPFDVAWLAAVMGRPVAAVLDRLGRLVDWNLVSLRTTPARRYRVLETIRQFALERAEAIGEAEGLGAAHLAWAKSALAELARRFPGDEAWCSDVDLVLADARAALQWAGERAERRPEAAGVAEVLADVLFQRGLPGEAQRRYEDAAGWSVTAGDRHRRLRLAAGSAAARNVGAEALVLLERSAEVALAADDPDGAAEDLAAAATFRHRASGIIAYAVDPDSTDALLERARQTSRGGARAEAAIAVAAGWTHGSSARSRRATQQALQRARAAGDALLEDIALDQLIVVELAEGDLEAATATVRARSRVLSSVPVDARSGFEFYDVHHMACHVDLAAGQLQSARRHADALAALPFLREERHLGLARRLEVDAMAGDFEAVVANGELFERDWERAGRPVAGNLAVGTYAAAMVHGMLGHGDQRSRWVDITRALTPSLKEYVDSAAGWAPTLDALLALHVGDAEAAVARLARAPDDDDTWRNPNSRLWLAWYAAAWVEASVLAGHPDAAARVTRAARAARGNGIALTMIERAAALHAGDRSSALALAPRFATAGCPYQASRTRGLAAA